MEIGKDTVAVVTGAASGLGAAVAEALARKGARVCIFDVDARAGEASADSINGLFCKVDVSNANSVAEGFSETRKRFGQERLVVNCAGVAPAARTVARGEPHDPDIFAKVVMINLIGTFNVASQAAAGMASLSPLPLDGERGVIINTASIAAFDSQIGQIAYVASKGGVAAMTLPMARDLAKMGIRVVVRGFPQEVQDALALQVPFPSRLGDPGGPSQFISRKIGC
jgi:NAD(P)-dependent dehydrogenase (short-subunit alcohol dehydrogenase family)